MLWVNIGSLFTYVFIGTCHNSGREYILDSKFANRTCPSSSVGFQHSSASLLSCLYLCFVNAACSGVVFQSSDKSCNGLRPDHNITQCTTDLADAEYYRENRVIHQWVETVTNFSSSSPSFDAIQVIGPPDCSDGFMCSSSWGAVNDTDSEFIEVAFSKAVYITGVDIYETNEVGLTTRISAIDSNEGEHVLFENKSVSMFNSNSRIFSPEIQVTDFKSSVLRVYIYTTDMVYTDIDAVHLHGRLW